MEHQPHLPQPSKYYYAKIYWVFIFSLMLGFAAFSFFYDGDFIFGISTIGFAIVISLILWQRRRFRPYWDLLMTIFIIILCTGIFYNIVQDFQKISLIESFFLGYSFAILKQILQSKIAKLVNIFSVDLALLLSRTLIVCSLNTDEVFSFGCITHAALSFVHFFQTYGQHRNEEINYEKLEKYLGCREELKDIKDYLCNKLSEGVLVMDDSFKETLFINQAFEAICVNSTGSLDISNSGIVASLQKIHTEKSMISHKGPTDTVTKGFNLPENGTLLNILEEIVKARSIRFDPINFRASSRDIQGQKRLFEIKAFTMLWDNKNAVIAILNDVTDKEAAANLKMCNLNKDRMISTVSHEFRTPLNGILGILSIIEKTTTDSEVLKYAWLCKNNASLLLSVANSMLDLQQIREAKFKLHTTRVEVTQMMDELKSLFEFQCESKGIFLSIQVQQEVPKYIFTDINRLKQILINLINNAVKFTFTGGITVDIALDEKDPNCIRFSVIDTGVGIEEEDKNKLFKMFGKLEKTEEINKGGTGLGLMISDTLARALNLTSENKGISVESQVKQGSTFSVSISKDLRKSPTKPRGDDSFDSDEFNVSSESLKSIDEKMNNHTVTNQRSSFIPSIKYNLIHYEGESGVLNKSIDSIGSPKKLLSVTQALSYLDADTPMNFRSETRKSELLTIAKAKKRSSLFKIQVAQSPSSLPTALVVDDNSFNIMVAQHLLQLNDFRVKTAFNGKMALDIVKNEAAEGHLFKVILMDCEMPIMNGFEATLALKKMIVAKEIPFIPIIALTAHDKEEDKKKCLECGMIDVLVKPINEKKLAKILEKFK